MVNGTDDRYNPVFMQTSVAIANQRISKAGQEGMKAFFEKRNPNWNKN
jgi:1,4-dihydroxy-2-naphthoyl-CoA synthase